MGSMNAAVARKLGVHAPCLKALFDVRILVESVGQKVHAQFTLAPVPPLVVQPSEVHALAYPRHEALFLQVPFQGHALTNAVCRMLTFFP